MLLTYIRNLLSFEHYINMFNKIAGPAMFCLYVLDILDVLGLLLLYHCLSAVFIAVSHCVMCVCRISIKITYLLTYYKELEKMNIGRLSAKVANNDKLPCNGPCCLFENLLFFLVVYGLDLAVSDLAQFFGCDFWLSLESLIEDIDADCCGCGRLRQLEASMNEELAALRFFQTLRAARCRR